MRLIRQLVELQIPRPVGPRRRVHVTLGAAKTVAFLLLTRLGRPYAKLLKRSSASIGRSPGTSTDGRRW